MKMTMEKFMELLEPDRVYPYQIDKKAYDEYLKALEILSKTNLEYMSDEPDQNYALHCVHIKWNSSNVSMSCKFLAKISSCFDEMSFDVSDNWWSFSKEIYKLVCC